LGVAVDSIGLENSRRELHRRLVATEQELEYARGAAVGELAEFIDEREHDTREIRTKLCVNSGEFRG
jgi:hypothetical protein